MLILEQCLEINSANDCNKDALIQLLRINLDLPTINRYVYRGRYIINLFFFIMYSEIEYSIDSRIPSPT